MDEPLRVTFAKWCRDARADLDITQDRLASAVGVSRSLIAAFETGRNVPDLDMVDRIGAVLGIDFRLVGRRPVVLGAARERDVLHARCSGHADRRLVKAGWETAREVELIDGRTRGWIDLLAFDPRTGRMLIVEIKTHLDDIGAIERQLGWYERLAMRPAVDRGWQVTAVATWLLVLATADADAAIGRQREVLAAAFPMRAPDLRLMLDGPRPGTSARGLALIDPARRRREWLLPSRLDGRRTAAPYRDRSDARARLVLARPKVADRRRCEGRVRTGV